MDHFKKKWIMYLGILLIIGALGYTAYLNPKISDSIEKKKKWEQVKPYMYIMSALGVTLFFLGGMFGGIKQ